MDTYSVTLQSEICCDECLNVIHNHFDCPSCGNKYAGTTIYGSLEDHDDNFFCEECGAEFTIVDNDWNVLIISKVDRTNNIIQK